MSMELTAKTPAGRDLVAIAERLAGDLSERAGVHDREGSYPFESIDALRRAGYFSAPVPVELGGLGVSSVHDVIVASGRLARGDASVAIGVNMHLVVVLNLERRWSMARASDNAARERAFAGSLKAIAAEHVVLAAAMSEPGQDLTRPSTRAIRTQTGWRIDGHKIFCTMSPAATALLTSVAFETDDGVERYGYVQIPAATPGLRINDDWDALGMRASGSHSVTLENVELPASALRGGFPAGDAVPYLERNLPSGLFHASASLGIAEAAFARAARPDRVGDDPRARMLVAESVIDLSASRAVLSRAATLIDEHHAANPARDGSDEEITALFAEGQAAKTFINEAATRVVDRSLALSGGAGYTNGSPLARAYRDVRAGAFMHPLGANRAYSFLGDVALGRAHALH
ncbi:acyl-CoA dehydrogenase family protein [Capillimicrobium parvum]|uniref:Acyl-CoA dehydrogenase YdbM n=1 Tax=Capillimicrobium parvum TaxID=2884022 RepID=A0A9E7BZ41_9ACTN|nr:acyl-CoA dehydrogenase family protein [Capillimicrobium parvum]UGS34920.1 Putative acyl-CoA dehydrogenase YdbM [Capillimicrobium parvum]